MSSSQLFALVFILLIIASGFRVIYNQILAARWGKSSENWPTVKGQITRANVQRYGGRNAGYHPSIAYSYRLDGTWYEAKRIEFGTPLLIWNSKDNATRLVSKYPKGSKATIYYHPDKPTLSTLQPGISRSRLVLGWVSCLLLIVFSLASMWIVISNFR